MEKVEEEEEVTVAEAEDVADTEEAEVEAAGAAEAGEVVVAAMTSSSSSRSTSIPCQMDHHHPQNASEMMTQLQLRTLFPVMGLKPPQQRTMRPSQWKRMKLLQLLLPPPHNLLT